MNERPAGAVVDGAGRVASAYTAPSPSAAQPTRLSIIRADHRKETACGRFHIGLSVNGARRQQMLLPLGWETDVAPEMGDQPQNIINKRILEDA